MRHLHETIRATHHLKHGGRIQYGLFIKGIGLSLEHSLKFWRDEFTKHIDIDKVDLKTTLFLSFSFTLDLKKCYLLGFYQMR